MCNICVSKFDHHCNWINNCVGRNNHMVFYGYITTLLLYFITLLILAFNLNEITIMKEDLAGEYSMIG